MLLYIFLNVVRVAPPFIQISRRSTLHIPFGVSERFRHTAHTLLSHTLLSCRFIYSILVEYAAAAIFVFFCVCMINTPPALALSVSLYWFWLSCYTVYLWGRSLITKRIRKKNVQQTYFVLFVVDAWIRGASISLLGVLVLALVSVLCRCVLPNIRYNCVEGSEWRIWFMYMVYIVYIIYVYRM